MQWQRWLYRLVLRPLARLGPGARYRLADALAWLLRDVVRYRRGVVDANLAVAFPERPVRERVAIRDAFYGEFVDTILEQVWLLDAPREEVLARCRFLDPELAERVAQTGRPLFVCAGHLSNYELAAAAFPAQTPQRVGGLYLPLVDAYFDGVVRASRERLGLEMWPRQRAARNIAAWQREGEPYAVLFANDQSPAVSASKVWLPFFGRPTAFARGIETLARRYDAVVVYAWAERIERGRYTFSFRVVTERPRDESPGEILRRQVAMLEAQIRRHPAAYLWSHRRWKLDYERDRSDTDLEVGLD